MVSALVLRSCRQLGGRLLRENAPKSVPNAVRAMSSHTQLAIPGIGFAEAQPVMEDATDDDIIPENELYQQQGNVARRIMTPSGASYSSVDVDSYASPFDQDYDQYSLHMSTFQAYNTTHEDLPHDLGVLEPEDVMNLEVVERYWETHPKAFKEDLPSVHHMEGEEFAPDVEDI